MLGEIDQIVSNKEVSPMAEIIWPSGSEGEEGTETSWFQEAVGVKGTEFSWSPVAAGDKGKAKMNGGPAFSPVGLKVLVVDDNRVCLAVLEKMLNRCKYTGVCTFLVFQFVDYFLLAHYWIRYYASKLIVMLKASPLQSSHDWNCEIHVSSFYAVTTCNSAAMALTLVQDKTTPFDLVLCDVHMPGMDGFKLLEALEAVRELPVISKFVPDMFPWMILMMNVNP